MKVFVLSQGGTPLMPTTPTACASLAQSQTGEGGTSMNHLPSSCVSKRPAYTQSVTLGWTPARKTCGHCSNQQWLCALSGRGAVAHRHQREADPETHLSPGTSTVAKRDTECRAGPIGAERRAGCPLRFPRSWLPRSKRFISWLRFFLFARSTWRSPASTCKKCAIPKSRGSLTSKEVCSGIRSVNMFWRNGIGHACIAGKKILPYKSSILCQRREAAQTA